MKTYQIKKTVDGFPSKTQVYEKGLSLDDAKAILNGHKKITGYENDTELDFSYEDENNCLTTFFIDEQ